MKGVIKITDRNRLRTGFAPLYALVILGIIIGSMYAERGHHSENMLVHQFFMPLYGGNTLFAVMKNTFLSVAAVLIAAFIGWTFSRWTAPWCGAFDVSRIRYRPFGCDDV